MSQRERGQKRQRRGSDSESELDDLASTFSNLSSPKQRTPPAGSYHVMLSMPNEDGGERRTENKLKTVKKTTTKKVTKYSIDPLTSTVTEVEVTEDEEKKVYSQESKKAEDVRPSQNKRQRVEHPMLRGPMPHNPMQVNYLTFPPQQYQPRPRIHRPVHQAHRRSLCPAPSPPQQNQNQQQKQMVLLSPSDRGYTTPRNPTTMQNERKIPTRPRPAPALLNFDRTPPNSSPSFRLPITSPTCPIVLRPPVTNFANLSSTQPPPQSPDILPPQEPCPSPYISTFTIFGNKPKKNSEESSTDEDSFTDSSDDNEDKNQQDAKPSTTNTTVKNE